MSKFYGLDADAKDELLGKLSLEFWMRIVDSITEEEIQKFPNARLAKQIATSPLAQALKEEE